MEYMISTAILLIAVMATFFSNLKLRRELAEVKRESAVKQLELERRVDKYREKYMFAETQRERERETYRESLASKTTDPSYNRIRELSGQRPLPSTGVTAGSRPSTTAVDSGPDMLTQMILLDALNSPTGTAAGTVTYDSNDVPTIHPVEIGITPDPEPARSSYSSIDSSSSYSSSSSDSSYSSSSSDSSSSSSDSSSSW